MSGTPGAFSGPSAFSALFASLTIKGLTLRNRFVMPGMQRGLMDDGAPTPRMVEYMRRCAAGGAGLIISESTSPDHPSANWQPVMGRLERATLGAWQQRSWMRCIRRVPDSCCSSGTPARCGKWRRAIRSPPILR